MTENRPDPDALLLRVQSEEANSRRGKLKIFLGAAPGVGKTYAMLEAARALAKDGEDVLIGYVEPHVRPETQALVLGLDVLARREIAYGGAKLFEFDLEAALAAKPRIIVVDEFAHTNAPGSTHAKRWQDVMQLLDAGIDVLTTLNVQHLESLNDVVAQITGVIVKETVPDSAFERADDVELVDIAPDDLLERLREGKVYLPQVAERAVKNFFVKGNLIALRELALRKAAERVGAQMDDYRELHAVSQTWAARERLLVSIGPSPFSARLVRATRRMAVGLRAPWIALHVETPDDAHFSDSQREQLEKNLHLAEQLGGETATIAGSNRADELLRYARSRNVTKIIVGKSKKPRWKEFLFGSMVYELTRKCGDIDVYVISGDPEPTSKPDVRPAAAQMPRRGYLAACFIIAVCTSIGWPTHYFFDPANIVMIYLLGIVAVALQFGRGPAVWAAILGVACFDFFFIPPQMTFAVADTQYLFTFAVMLFTAVVISTLTARVKFQAESARSGERRTASLYAVSRELTALRDRDEIARSAARLAKEALDGRVVVMLADKEMRLTPFSGGEDNGIGSHDEAVARWTVEHGLTAGRGTATLPGAQGVYFPLNAAHGCVGALGVFLNDSKTALGSDKIRLLETFAGLIAMAVERADLERETERIKLQMETERLRSSLLSAVSHDLRTPLSVVTGAASVLSEACEELPLEKRKELLDSILSEAERLNRLVANLLDMTRLEAGALTARKEWTPLEEAVGSALTRMRRQLAGRTVTTNIPAELPLVKIDDLLMQQVFINLLENAIKYSPAGSPIDISASNDRNSIIIEIVDHGAGIAEPDLERIFDKFYRGSSTACQPGAGLGLPICRGIVELHGGRISAANRPDGGAVFLFTLPLDEAPPSVAILKEEA